MPPCDVRAAVPQRLMLCCLLQMVHSFATEITGKPLDFTQPVAEAVHALT